MCHTICSHLLSLLLIFISSIEPGDKIIISFEMNVCRCTLHSDDYGNAQTLSMLMSDKCFVFRAFDTIFDENIPDGSRAMVFYEPVNQFYQKHHWKNDQQVFDWRLIRYNLQRFNAMLCPESLVKSEYKYLLGADFKKPRYTKCNVIFYSHPCISKHRDFTIFRIACWSLVLVEFGSGISCCASNFVCCCIWQKKYIYTTAAVLFS